MILVVDITKGIQTQTAECIIIGEITCDKLLVVLNKLDLIAKEKRDSAVKKVSTRIHKALEKTKFANVNIIAVAAKSATGDSIELDRLLESLSNMSFVPERNTTGKFLMAIDHCFPIRGQGTVVTGTVIQGKVNLNDNIEIPSSKIVKRVKGIQMFKAPISSAAAGDRIGICLTQFDHKLVERGVACSPGYLSYMYGAIVSVKIIPYFKKSLKTKSKFHLHVMHDTTMARVSFFSSSSDSVVFNFGHEYEHVQEVNLEDGNSSLSSKKQLYAVVEFETPVIASESALIIASKLDTDINANVCRLAFHGNILAPFHDKDYANSVLQKLKVYKLKYKEGVVDRILNEHEIIGKSLLKKESNVQAFVGLKVLLNDGSTAGFIDGGFGQSGKVKIRIPEGLKDVQRLKRDSVGAPNKICLQFKRYIYEKSKKIIQA